GSAIAAALAAPLARIAARQREAVTTPSAAPVRWGIGLPTSPQPDAPMPPAGTSGFRRLAALVARPDAGRAELAAGTDAGPEYRAAGLPASAPTTPASLRENPREQTEATFASRAQALAPILQRINGDASGDADMAERLARILRREARRQG